MTQNADSIQVHDVAYHRNGVCGEGFYAITFSDPDVGAMVAIVFSYVPTCDRESEQDRACRVAVLSLGKLAEGNIRFGENSWRGDRYADDLYRAIDKYAAQINTSEDDNG